MKRIDPAKFAANVRAARVSKHLRQSDVAERMGVTPAAYSHLECGRRLPSLPMFLTLCDALGWPADDLLSGVTK